MENFSKDKYIELISRIYFKWGGTVKINNEKQKGYDKVISGKVKWNKGNLYKRKKK